MYPEKFTVKRVWRREGAQSVTDEDLNDVSNGNELAAIRSLRACANRFGAVAVDAETTGLDPKNDALVLLTIATPDTAWVYTPDLIGPDVLRLLQSGVIKKLAQYAPFDWGFVRKHLDIDMYPMWDTRRAVCSRYPYEAGTSLGDLSKRYLDLPLDKSMQLAFVGAQPPYAIDSRHIEYAGVDALILWPLMFAMLARAFTPDEFQIRSDDVLEMRRYVEGRSDVLPQSRRYGSLAQSRPRLSGPSA